MATVAAWPAGTGRPTTSTVNARRGAAVANSAIIPLGVDGSIDLFAPATVAMIVDVSAVFVPAASSRAGRFVPLPPTRLLDTRDGTVVPESGADAYVRRYPYKDGRDDERAAFRAAIEAGARGGTDGATEG
mgnify:CR=1 FL=1